MRLRFGEVLADVAGLWRGRADVLIAIAGVFFFLPQFAIQLFVPVLDLTGLEAEARSAAILAYFGAQFHWFAGQYVIESMGVGALLLVLLDPSGPSAGEAMARGFRLLPGLVAARLVASAAVTLGLMLMFVPGFYLMGRTFLTSAVYVAESERGPAGAAVAAFERARGNGWLLFLIVGMAWATSFLLGGTLKELALSAEPLGPFASGPLNALTALLLAACMLLAVLLEAAAYRALSVPRQGT